LAGAAAGGTLSACANPERHPRREGFERFVAGDPEGLLGLFAEDAV